MRLHSRIFALVLLMLLGLGGTSSLFLYNSARKNVEADVADRLMLAQRTFVDSFNSRQKQLIDNVRAVVNDWGLRQAIGQRDKQTVQSVLVNHSNRVGADVAIFLDEDHKLFASTLGPATELSANVLNVADSQTSTTHLFTRIDKRYYQLVLADVRAPVHVGWLGMGFLIDDALATHFSRLSDVGVSFVYRSGPAIDVFATSLSEKSRSRAASQSSASGRELWPVSGPGWEDLVLHQNLDRELSGLVVVLQKSLSDPLAKFRSWWWSLLTIFALISGFGLCMAWMISRGITRPLNQLLTAVKDMEVGDYSTNIDVQRNDEIGSLSKSFIRMQSAIAEREDEIRYRAEHDLATDTFNHSGFLEIIEQQIVAADTDHSPLAVVCLRLNHFKQIVDALGHGWGDKLLRLVAERLASVFPDGKLAHVNSDEFFMSFRPESVSALFTLGEKVHQCLDTEFRIRGIALTLTANVGISVYPDHATDGQNLLRRASVALNEAIEHHQRNVVYDPNLDQNSVKRLTLMSELPKAIKDNQLTLHFQPKVHCAGDQSTVEGVECLVRWNHPELGFIPPDEFIGLAEKTGYIVELTRHVLRQAIAQCSEWRKRNLGLTVSVNISAVDLQQSALAHNINALLQEYELPAQALCLEITESAAMEDPDSALRRLTALKDLGIRLSIDDYGTGYSSLAQLKKLPVHELKIDKSFVMELDRHEDDQIIVRSTVELAHNIGLAVVAEGVESERILRQLDDWQVDYVQGFHISKPLALPAIDRWLETTTLIVKPVLSGVRSAWNRAV